MAKQNNHCTKTSAIQSIHVAHRRRNNTCRMWQWLIKTNNIYIHIYTVFVFIYQMGNLGDGHDVSAPCEQIIAHPPRSGYEYYPQLIYKISIMYSRSLSYGLYHIQLFVHRCNTFRVMTTVRRNSMVTYRLNFGGPSIMFRSEATKHLFVLIW